MKLRRLACIACGMLVAAAPAISAQAASQTAISWGLGYDKPGEIPKGNTTSDYLKKYNACFHGSADERVLYLTFDAGYENGYTEKLLDVLKENEVPAAFFLVGTYLKKNPELVKRMVNEGHIIGNHTMSHKDMSKVSPEAFASELKRFEEDYKYVVGDEMKKFYRPPSGIFNESNLITAHGLNYKTLLWSITYADWDNKNQPTRQHAFSKLMPRLHPGGIILLHSTSAINAEILGDFIAECRKLGYEFKSVDEM